MKPVVSIGICVKDCATIIHDTVESIMNQSFPHKLMEIIFVDDGSKDDTLSIIENLISGIDIHSKIFHHEWKGLGASRNLILKEAEGDYIIWVDGDMTLSRDYIKEQVKFMEQHPEAGIIKGKQTLEPGGNLLATLETYSRAASRMVDYTSEKSVAKALGTGGSICRVKAVKQVGGFDESLRGYGEDMDLEMRMRKARWLLHTIDVKFCDFERNRLSWKLLWNKYWIRGYFAHYFLHKNRGIISHYKMLPPIAFLTGLIHSRKIFGLTNQKSAFILPIQYVFKMSAWYMGFIKSHIHSYQPSSRDTPSPKIHTY